MTRRTAISLPDDLYEQIERARRRAKKDRSTWLQEAASEYLKKRSREAEVEQYFAGWERAPLTEDEISLLEWSAQHFGEGLEDAAARPTRKGR